MENTYNTLANQILHCEANDLSQKQINIFFPFHTRIQSWGRSRRCITVAHHATLSLLVQIFDFGIESAHGILETFHLALQQVIVKTQLVVLCLQLVLFRLQVDVS